MSIRFPHNPFLSSSAAERVLGSGSSSALLDQLLACRLVSQLRAPERYVLPSSKFELQSLLNTLRADAELPLGHRVSWWDHASGMIRSGPLRYVHNNRVHIEADGAIALLNVTKFSQARDFAWAMQNAAKGPRAFRAKDPCVSINLPSIMKHERCLLTEMAESALLVFEFPDRHAAHNLLAENTTRYLEHTGVSCEVAKGLDNISARILIHPHPRVDPRDEAAWQNVCAAEISQQFGAQLFYDTQDYCQQQAQAHKNGEWMTLDWKTIGDLGPDSIVLHERRHLELGSQSFGNGGHPILPNLRLETRVTPAQAPWNNYPSFVRSEVDAYALEMFENEARLSVLRGLSDLSQWPIHNRAAIAPIVGAEAVYATPDVRNRLLFEVEMHLLQSMLCSAEASLAFAKSTQTTYQNMIRRGSLQAIQDPEKISLFYKGESVSARRAQVCALAAGVNLGPCRTDAEMAVVMQKALRLDLHNLAQFQRELQRKMPTIQSQALALLERYESQYGLVPIAA